MRDLFKDIFLRANNGQKKPSTRWDSNPWPLDNAVCATTTAWPSLLKSIGAIVCWEVSDHNTSRSRPRHCGTAAAGSAWRCRRTTRSCRWRLATPRSPGRGGSSATTRPTWPTSNTSNGCFQNVSRLKIYQLKLQSVFYPTSLLPAFPCQIFLASHFCTD